MRDALVEQVARSETDRYTFKGIPHLECVEAALPRLTPAELAAVLSVGAGSMDSRPWEQIANEAIGRLTAQQRSELRAAAAVEHEKPARPNSGSLMTLLE